MKPNSSIIKSINTHKKALLVSLRIRTVTTACTPATSATTTTVTPATLYHNLPRCDVDLQMKDGSTPLHFAAYNGHASVKKQLIELHCNIDLQQNDGVTPVYIAAQRGVMCPSRIS